MKLQDFNNIRGFYKILTVHHRVINFEDFDIIYYYYSRFSIAKNMWPSRSSSQSSSDTHKLRNAKIVRQSALKTPRRNLYDSNYSSPKHVLHFNQRHSTYVKLLKKRLEEQIDYSEVWSIRTQLCTPGKLYFGERKLFIGPVIVVDIMLLSYYTLRHAYGRYFVTLLCALGKQPTNHN